MSRRLVSSRQHRFRGHTCLAPPLAPHAWSDDQLLVSAIHQFLTQFRSVACYGDLVGMSYATFEGLDATERGRLFEAALRKYIMQSTGRRFQLPADGSRLRVSDARLFNDIHSRNCNRLDHWGPPDWVRLITAEKRQTPRPSELAHLEFVVIGSGDEDALIFE